MNPAGAAALWFDGPRVEPFGQGHIHDTYRVRAGGEDFIMQRVNRAVFADPELVMRQTLRLLDHWRRQADYVVPQLVPDRCGQVGVWHGGEFWRVWRFVANTVVVEPIETAAQARAAGTAFAALQHALADLPGDRFVDTIPGFLQLGHYLQIFDRVSGKAPAALRGLIETHRGLARQLGVRNAYVHGDCKINNLLFDPDRVRVVAIIDFDTAMYGHWAWDFGDLVRSVSHSRGAVEAAFFGACLEGFARHQPLTNVADSVAAPAYVALMLGVRFLTDHLQGDRYFRVARRGENLERAREQLELFEVFRARQPLLQEAARQVMAERVGPTGR